MGERQREFELDFPRFAAWSRTWQCHPFLFSIFLFSGVRESSTGSSRDNTSIGGCWIFQWLEAEQSPERGAEAARAHRGILPAPSFPQGAVQECQQLLWGFFFAGPGVFLASHFFPGLLPAGFQDGVVGVPRVLLRQQGDVERPQQPRGPERAERKSKSLLSAQFSPGWRDQSWFLSLRAAASCPPSIPSRIEGDRGHEGAVITGRNLKIPNISIQGTLDHTAPSLRALGR